MSKHSYRLEERAGENFDIACLLTITNFIRRAAVSPVARVSLL